MISVPCRARGGASNPAPRNLFSLCVVAFWHGCAPAFKDRRSPQFAAQIGSPRSEEHTSELQSLMRISYAVFCLKKKRNNNTTKTILSRHHTDTEHQHIETN